MELAGLERFAGCWARLRARLEIRGGEPAWPRLELDRGCGYSPLHALPLPECRPGAARLDYVLRLPAGLARARLAPGSACELVSWELTPLSAGGAALRMLAAIGAADGAVAAACHAWAALREAMRGARGAARRYRFIERYHELRVCRGGGYEAWLRAFEPRGTGAAGTRIAVGGDPGAPLPDAEFVAFLEPGDALHPRALELMGQAVSAHPQAGLFYSDEDRIDASGRRFAPYFKCALNYELLLAHDMVGGLAVYRRSLLDALGGVSGAHDRALRAVERLPPEQVVHVPHVLYHRRAEAARASLTAIDAHLARRGSRASVAAAPEAPGMARVRYALPEPLPTVSIIVPTRDRLGLLQRCLASVARSRYVNHEIVIVDNASREPATLAYLAGCGKRVLRDDAPFNFSALANRAVRVAAGEFVCLLNNDVEALSEDWLEEMLSFAAQPGIGAVGARLWYPDGRLQHGGVILGLAGDHAHRHLPRGETGYFGRAAVHQSFSAVTGACLMVRKSAYVQVGGMDERLAVSFNDIDLCLRLRAAGYRNVWTPYAELVHLESASRATRRSPEEERVLAQETRIFEERWGNLLADDPAYSPNLTLDRTDFSPAWPPRLHHQGLRTRGGSASAKSAA